MDYIPTVKRAKDADSIRQAFDAAERDGWSAHTFPTHLIHLNNEPVGYWSFGNIPVVLAWHDHGLRVRHSQHIFGAMDTVASERNFGQYILAVQPDSPYIPVMDKFGFKLVGTSNLYTKEV